MPSGFPGSGGQGTECRLAGCSEPVRCRGLCKRHYDRARDRARHVVRELPVWVIRKCDITAPRPEGLTVSTCWCERQMVLLRWDEVNAGQTRTCGHLECFPLAVSA